MDVGSWKQCAQSGRNFGVKGVPSPSNEPPGVYEACEWADQQGNFWIYGGQRLGFNFYGAMWKYDPASNQWTWVNGSNVMNQNGVFGTKGVSSPSNTPGCRGWAASSWTDKNGNLWMFGGNSAGGDMNDLWKYTISTNEWTWMKGSNNANSSGSPGVQGIPSLTNEPAARHENACAWVDLNGDLWLFGGDGPSQCDDLWRYNIASNMWTWMKGTPTTSVPAVHGTMGIANPTNTPGGRNTYSHWIDASGNLWTFGGFTYGIASWNDLWKFDVSSNNWTWMKGPNTAGDLGSYGTKCTALSTNVPAARFESRSCWKDSCGDFWLFGGSDSVYTDPNRNDLWKYSVATNNWIWVNGSQALNPSGNYGVKGVSSPLNSPRGRMGSNSWIDSNGHLWLFGGSVTPALDAANDLWTFAPNPACTGGCGFSLPVANFVSSDTAFCNESGGCIDFTDHSINNPTAWKWSFPGAVPDTSTQQNPTNICYYIPGTYPVTLIVSNSNGIDTLTVSPMITFSTGAAKPMLTFSGDTLFSSHASTYQWYLNGSVIPGATDSFYVAIAGGIYSVMIVDENGCSRLSDGFAVGVNELSLLHGIRIYPNPVQDELNISFNVPFKESGEIIITDGPGQEIERKNIRSNQQDYHFDTHDLAAGIYLLKISSGGRVMNCKFIVIGK